MTEIKKGRIKCHKSWRINIDVNLYEQIDINGRKFNPVTLNLERFIFSVNFRKDFA